MRPKPLARKVRDISQCAWLFKQVSGTRNNFQPFFAAELFDSLPVQVKHGIVVTTDDQERWGLHVR